MTAGVLHRPDFPREAGPSSPSQHRSVRLPTLPSSLPGPSKWDWSCALLGEDSRKGPLAWQGHASRVKLPGTAKGRPLRTSNRTQPVPGLGRSGRRGKEVSPPNGRRTAGPTSGPLPLPPSAPPPPARTKPSPRRGPRRTRPSAPRLALQLPAGRELRSRTRSVRSPCAPRSPPFRRRPR